MSNRIPHHWRAAIWALAAIVIVVMAFAEFGHNHASSGDNHLVQPCAACVAVSVLVTGLIAAAIFLKGPDSPQTFAPILTTAPRERLIGRARAQRAPPAA